ncbi:MAG: hypothetical protein HQK83_07695 [Fibrobacteria bacterium]|nr:hypothetical protein [Fibrobacteria bacterium]
MNKIVNTVRMKGGSLSGTYLLEDENGFKFIRKNVSLTENREYGFQRWYSQLKKIQRFSLQYPGLFPNLLDYGSTETHAYFDIEYFENSFNAQEYLCQNSKNSNPKLFFEKLVSAMDYLHEIKLPTSKHAMRLYLHEEVHQRLKDCNQNDVFTNFLKYDTIVFNGIEVNSFLHEYSDYEAMAMRVYQKDYESFTHGNLTLENMLYIPDQERIVFIDPYEENVIDSILAEYSQIYQSSNSLYELYNAKGCVVFENCISSNIEVPTTLIAFNELFTGYINRTCSDDEIKAISILEISQFIRMLPFKMVVDSSKMLLFYALASYLWHQLKAKDT